MGSRVAQLGLVTDQAELRAPSEGERFFYS